jgi:hypothetical protein
VLGPYRGVWKPRFVQFSFTLLFHLVARFNSEQIFFLHNSSSSSMSPAPRASSVATTVSSAAPAVGTTTLAAAIEVALDLVAGNMPHTLEGCPRGCVRGVGGGARDGVGAGARGGAGGGIGGGVMFIAHAATPSSPRGVAEASSPAPHAAAAVDTTVDVVGEPEVVMGHPTFHGLSDIPLDEAMSMAHKALSQALRVLHREDEDLTDKHRHL